MRVWGTSPRQDALIRQRKERVIRQHLVELAQVVKADLGGGDVLQHRGPVGTIRKVAQQAKADTLLRQALHRRLHRPHPIRKRRGGGHIEQDGKDGGEPPHRAR